MVYRIHFTLEDLARTRLAQAPPALMELAAAVRTLQTSTHSVRFGAWRRSAARGLRPDTRMVLDLVPPRGWAPTFLSPAGLEGPQEALENVRATPRSRIRRELAHVATWQPLPPWAHALADDRDLLRQLCDSLDHLFAVLLSPHWQQITSATTADRGARTRQVADGGMEHLLSMLHPRRIRWNPPVLEQLVLDLVSVMSRSPTCLLPAVPGEPQELLERKHAPSSRLLAQELAAVAERRGRRLPAWASRVSQDPELLRLLYRTVSEMYEYVLAPYWPHVHELLTADRALRTRAFAEGGIERLLTGLCPRHITWNPPVLSLTVAGGHSGELRMEGRGLLLVPTMFGAEAPVVDPYAEPQPVVTYPASCGETRSAPAAAVTWQSHPTAPKALEGLLGRTRAAVLYAIAERPGTTTRELAARLNIAPASASEHATVLRQAGLTTSTRRRNAMLHAPTTAGITLLNAPARTRPPT
ncbi:DUF5937 family protein [Streptomyces longispororuber]|uniref:DUF5937 family protein n=1 Tax=Streptomyces longispororuber TaxID=68230 RepID=UPI0033D5CA65